MLGRWYPGPLACKDHLTFGETIAILFHPSVRTQRIHPMKNLTPIGALLFFVGTALSQQPQLNIRLKNGDVRTFPLTDITKITFDPVTGVGDTKKLQNIVKAFTLFQNYPNPFNPTTTIAYELPKAGTAEIKIFDLNGRLIRQLTAEHQQIGTHQLVWNGRDETGRAVASGLYFYQTRFENSVISKKMMLLK